MPIVSEALPPVYEKIQSTCSAPPSFVLQLLLCPDSCLVKCACALAALAPCDFDLMVLLPLPDVAEERRNSPTLDSISSRK